MSELHYFCPNCWEEIPKDTKICPFCGANLEDLEEKNTYLEKLILALRSKDGFTARRAAYILGEIGNPQAIDALATTIEEQDPYVAAEAVMALAKIGGIRALDIVERAKSHPYITVRKAAFEAEKILKR
jgi:HEAT repeat protein